MVEHIGDPDDPRLADYRHIGDPAWLRARGLFVAESRLVVGRLLSQERFTIRSILLTPAAYEALQLSPVAPVFVVPQAVLNQVTGFNFHRGCLALAHRPAEEDVHRILAGERLLALEGIGNPDNIGGLFRVAAAFGVSGVLLDPNSGDPFYRKAIRTSMGATLSVPFARDLTWPATLDTCRTAGHRVIALTPRPSAVPIRSVVVGPSEPFVVIAGAEGHGLTEGALQRADLHVRIPIAPDVDSLNVTIATAIALAFLALWNP